MVRRAADDVVTSAVVHVPFRRRLDLRLALLVAVLLPVVEHLVYVVDVLDLFPPDEQTYWEIEFRLATLIYSSIVGVIVAAAVWLVATRRIRQLSSAAVQAARTGASEARPFVATGGDEVAYLATTLNELRERTVANLEALEVRDATRREWVAQVSHDLRTPATVMLVSLEEARTRALEAPESEERARVLAAIDAADQSAKRMSTMTSDLLEVARLEAQPSLRPELVSPRELAMSVARSLESEAREAAVKITVDVPAELDDVEADGRLLIHALANLARNGLRHAREHVRLSALRSGDADGRIVFQVDDDGPSLPGDGAELTFAELREHRAREGSDGLGLMVAERVASAHGGVARARARDDGRGSSIRVEIPSRR